MVCLFVFKLLKVIMLVKVAELIGPALDWAVAKAEKHQPRYGWMP